jgi:hypothetical protein
MGGQIEYYTCLMALKCMGFCSKRYRLWGMGELGVLQGKEHGGPKKVWIPTDYGI